MGIQADSEPAPCPGRKRKFLSIYGYLWWIPEPERGLKAFAACGVGTQVLLVVPELELVIVQRVDTFIGKSHPFDPALYRMIAGAVRKAGKGEPESVPLPPRPEKPQTAIPDKEGLAGAYRAADGIYRVRPYGDGLLVTYPGGMRARLLPRPEPGTFLVEDILEVIRLDGQGPGKTGRLTVLGVWTGVAP